MGVRLDDKCRVRFSAPAAPHHNYPPPLPSRCLAAPAALHNPTPPPHQLHPTTTPTPHLLGCLVPHQLHLPKGPPTYHLHHREVITLHAMAGGALYWVAVWGVKGKKKNLKQCYSYGVAVWRVKVNKDNLNINIINITSELTFVKFNLQNLDKNIASFNHNLEHLYKNIYLPREQFRGQYS